MIGPKEPQLFDKYRDDFIYCENIIKKNSTSFYTAFSTLPKEKALSVYAIYAFCRLADDYVDEDKDLQKLNALKLDLDDFANNQDPQGPLWRALRVVSKNFDIDLTPFYEQLEGQKRDFHFCQPNTQAELKDYCYDVAGTVGLMLLPLLTDQQAQLKEFAVALGNAMQITNILRDIGEDLDEGLVYLPKKVMEEHGYTMVMLQERTINQQFINLWEYEANEAEKDYDYSLSMMPMIYEDSRRPLLLSLYIYRGILDVVRESNYDCFSKRNYVSKIKQAKLIAQAEIHLAKINKKRMRCH